MFDFLSKKFSGVLSWLKDKSTLSQESIDKVCLQVKEALLEADVPFSIVKSFLQEITVAVDEEKLVSASKPGHRLIKIVHEKLLALLGTHEVIAHFNRPSIIMSLGLQGAGKTTTLAKIGFFLKKKAQKKGKTVSILAASLDYTRPAAREQLAILSRQVGVDYYEASATSALEAVPFILERYKSGSYDYLLLDTAGRLQIDEKMIEELQVVTQAVKPEYKMLVVDSMIGQESLAIAQEFNNTIGFDGGVITKFDSDAKGGVALSFRAILKKPIWFVGSGEHMQDLDTFIPERIVSRLIGMGDLATLLEKADEMIKKEDQERFSKKLLSGYFNLEDFAQHIDMLSNMGPLQKILSYLPGMNQIPTEAIEKGQAEVKCFRAIINSMTPKERTTPSILDNSRKQRIARGAGVEVIIVNRMLQKFEEMKQYAKMLKKMSKFQRFFN